MKGRTLALAAVTFAAVVTLGVLGTWRWAQATGPDVNNDGYVNIIDIGHVVRDFGQMVPTPSPTATPTLTPMPTPTRVPGMLDVEVKIGVLENVHLTNDLQPFGMTVTVYNHGDNPTPEMVYVLVETTLANGTWFNANFDRLGVTCPAGNGHGLVGGGPWSLPEGAGEFGDFGLKTTSPGMYANTQDRGEYRMVCSLAGQWRDSGVGNNDVLDQGNTATITASLRDENGNPLIDGNPANNVDVEIVELIVP